MALDSELSRYVAGGNQTRAHTEYRAAEVTLAFMREHGLSELRADHELSLPYGYEDNDALVLSMGNVYRKLFDYVGGSSAGLQDYRLTAADLTKYLADTPRPQERCRWLTVDDRYTSTQILWIADQSRNWPAIQADNRRRQIP